MTLLPAETSIFDTITGLPVHPLVVHFAVVLLPIAALVQIALVFVPRLRARWATVTLLGLAAGTLFAFISKESGEALAARVGNPRTHSFWGDILPPVALVLVLVTAAWWWLQRRDRQGSRAFGAASGGGAVLLTGLLSAVLALAATIITVIVGHSGAQAAWGGRLDQSTTTTTATPAATAPAAGATTSSKASTSSTSTTSTAASGLTMAAVQQHATASSCWSVVNGNVYDLTAWIGSHPGGQGPIKSMCGVDATAAFTDQHGGDNKVANRLAAFKLGKLAG